MRSRSHRTWLVGLVIASTCASSWARADDVADAKDLFGRARELRGNGDCASAVPLFRKAYELYPAGLGSLRNIAECAESMGRFASARRAWLDLKRALLTQTDSKYEGWAQDAGQAAARLAPKLATVTIDVNAVAPTGATAPVDQVEVIVNGERLPPSLVGTPLERDPGRYIVRVAGAGVSAAEEKVVELAAGDAKRIALQVVVSVQLPEAPGASPPPDRDKDAKSHSPWRTAGWVTLGVGGASLIGAAVSLFVRQAALDDLARGCSQYQTAPCDPSLTSTVDRGHTASTLVNVLGPLGIVALAGGGVLLAVSASHPSPMALVLSPPGISAVGRF
jgi:hypothetical protein